MKPAFTHLHVHSEYAIKDSIVRLQPFIEQVKAQGMTAVALTDPGNLFGLVKFYKLARAAGIKPIVGAEVGFYNPAVPQQHYQMVLLCQNITGYRNLTQLLSRGYLDGQQDGVPLVERQWILALSQGLLALSGGRAGDVGQALLAGKTEQAATLLADWCQHFPQRFYLEVNRCGHTQDEPQLQASIKLALQTNVPVVATNNVCFLNQTDFNAHEARVCIHEGWVLEDQRRERQHTNQQYLRSPAEMIELFSDLPEAIENSHEIAKRCNLELTLGQSSLPNFPVPANTTVEAYLETKAKSDLEVRLLHLFPDAQQRNAQRQPYDQRLSVELKVINNMGFPGYFLIVADFIHWAKTNDIPVGPGRGSGAGSLVAYALQITDIDPLAYDLLFERFLNPERVSMPDFDIDFCMEGRDRVIDYVAQTYGRECVAQIITYGTMAAKAVVRDVGRVLGYPYGFVDKIAKLIPFELGMTLKKALQQEEQLLNRFYNEEDVKTLIELALNLEGITRNAGKHAGGVVIAPGKLTDFTPLYCESGGAGNITQFDKDDVEAVGLVKFDFLGLRTLTIIHWALQTINARLKQVGKDPIDMTYLPLDDPQTFQHLQACQTTAVFQLESRGMKDLIKRLVPDCFDNIVALVALFRPGPLQSGMVDDFINRKHGRTPVRYPHPKLEAILAPTYGVILYQEQVMQIAQVLAGYTLGEADILRKAMGKKKPEEMAKQRAIFVDGAKKNNVDGQLANSIFDLMEKFAGYGFNKSHSVAYAMIAYQTAWLKAHYPAEFMAAVLSSDMDNTDKIVSFIADCKQLDLKILPPDANLSQFKFSVTAAGDIRYGLGAIKGAGEAALSGLLAEREKNGAFTSLFECCQRLTTSKVNRRVFEALICAGALDCFGKHRAILKASLASALKAAEQTQRRLLQGQRDLFASAGSSTAPPLLDYVDIAPWSEIQRLSAEKETLGLYLSGHPVVPYKDELKHFITAPVVQLVDAQSQHIVIAGFICALRYKMSKKGAKLCFLTLEDDTGQMDVSVFSETLEGYQATLNQGGLLVIEGDIQTDDFTGLNKVVASRVDTLAQARVRFGHALVLTLHQAQINADFNQQLQEILKPFCGGQSPVVIHYQNDQAKTHVCLGELWRVRPEDLLLEQLRSLLGDAQVSMSYSKNLVNQ